MKIKYALFAASLSLMFLQSVSFAQTITLGSAANFVLFTSNGAITNVGPSHVTGDVGSNVGAATGFGNVNGNMQSTNGITALAASDLATAYIQLNTATPAFFPASPLGNGSTLTAGVYSLSGNTTLNNTLTLNAQGTSTAVFIFQINGTFAANANAVVILSNGALACNVYWKVEGAVSLSTLSSLKGTIIANNAAITLAAGAMLEGRALSTTGAIGTNSVLAYTPIGCGSASLTGPASPTLNSVSCYAIFSSDGAVTNVGVTTVTGDIGTNNGSALGFNPLLVSGSIHAIPDLSTAQCSVDLGFLYTYLNTLPADITLMFPAQFGNNLVLTPHTYLMNGGVTLTDSLFLNAQGNPNAIFVIQINGALSTSAPCKVILMNGAQSKNVYWKVDGAVSLNAGAIFKGTIVANNAAILLATGVSLDGRALSTTGAVGISASTISIPGPLSIGSAPSSITVCAGTAATFTVESNGTTFQWRKGTTNLSNGGTISGATSATLVINPANVSDASSDYNVIISGICGTSYTSPNVSLVINTSPSITAQSGSQTVCAGSSLSFTASATGTDLIYQWRKGNSILINAGTISGATTATLLISAASTTDAATDYNLIVSGLCAPDFTSSPITLVVNTPPSSSVQVPSHTVCAGSLVSFSVNASGSGLNYQWRNGTVNLTNSGSISGANTATLTINPVAVSDASSNYNVVVSGLCAPAFTSGLISLLVNSSPTIIAQIASQTVCAGSSVNFSVNATGTGLTYQWRNGTVNLTNGAGITGATSATLSINPVDISHASSNYNIVITGVCAPGFTSSLFSLVVNTSPTISVQVPSQTVCAGSAVIFSVNATGTGLTYQWRDGIINLVNSIEISGANTATLSINPVNVSHSSSNYNLIINGVCAPDYTSSLISLVVNTSPSITAVVPSQTICEGSIANFSVNATGSGLSYQWRNGTVNLINGGTISGATSTLLTFNPVNSSDASTNYNLLITGSCAPNFTTNSFELFVTTSPSITASAISQTACVGSTISFSTNSTGSGLTYQWRNGTINLVNTASVSGVNTATLSINPVSTTDASNNYNLVITGVCAPAFTTQNVSLLVNELASITLQPSSQNVCSGSSVSFSTANVGTALIYQWKKGSVNLVNGGNISGADSGTLTINPSSISDAGSDYYLIVSSTCSNDYTSAPVSLVVNTAPGLSTQISSQTACTGGAAIFAALTTGTGLSYQWRKGTSNLIDAGTISGVQTATLKIDPTTSSDAGTDYNLIITGVCSPNYTSANVTLFLTPFIVASTSANTTQCVGTTIQLMADSISGATYNWSGPKSFSSTIQNPLIISATLENSGNYTLTISTPGCAASSASMNVLIENCVSDDFFIPEGFSPNGDGINDLFVVRGITNYPKNKFIVFNRWGNKMYEASPYKSEWDGKSTMGVKVGSEDSQVGTYFYVLDLGEGSKVFKGTIYLNK